MSPQYDESAPVFAARRERGPEAGGRHACRTAGAAAAALVALLTACSAGAPVRQAGDDAAPPEAVETYAAAIDAMRRGDSVEAELRLEQLIERYPELPGPYVNLAILYRHEGRDGDARAMLERALELDPGHSEANNELGILLREAGEFDAAEEAYRRALAEDAGYLPALYNLGVLLDLYLHRRDEALACYEAYQQGLAEPDETVALWIIDLRRRVGSGAERVARRSAQ